MKKLLAILLAMMLVMVNVWALADDPDTTNPETTTETTGTGDNPTNPAGGAAAGTTNASGTSYAKGSSYTLAATAQQTIVLPKVYTVTLPGDQVAPKNLPTDTVTLAQVSKTVANSTTVTEAPDLVSISQVAISESGNGAPNTDDEYSYDVSIVLPSFTGVGIYTYTLEETDNGVAGVTYIGDIVLKVTVVQNVQANALQIAGIAIRKSADSTSTAADTKIDTLDNTYKAGGLKVTKMVDGNMGDQSKPFPITVTFTAPEGKTVSGTITYTGAVEGSIAPSAWTNNTASVTLNLTHNQTVQFDNIPDGVTYTVVETDAINHLNAATEEQDDPDSYKVDGEVTDATAIAAGSTTAQTITNTKEVTVDTGIALDTMPYALLMALAFVGFAAMKTRRREEY